MNFLKDIGGGMMKGLAWDPIKHATGLTDAQMALIGATAIAAPYALPMMGTAGTGAAGAGAAGGAGVAGTEAGAAGAAGASGGSGGLLSTLGTYGKPAMATIQGATMAKGLLASNQQPMQAPQLPQAGGGDLSGLIQANNQQLAALQQKRQQRQGLLGGNYGG
jgi:hypothetical protein